MASISVAEVVQAVEGGNQQSNDVVAETIYKALSNLSVYEVAAAHQAPPKLQERSENQTDKKDNTQ